MTERRPLRPAIVVEDEQQSGTCSHDDTPIDDGASVSRNRTQLRRTPNRITTG